MIEKLEENPQAGAINWLLEMELIGNPAVLNSVFANIIASTRGLKDIQLVIDSLNKRILVYVELKKWYGWFFKSSVEEKLDDMLEQILPSYKKRVTFDRIILEKAIKIAKGLK